MKNGCPRNGGNRFRFQYQRPYLMTVTRLVITPFSVAIRTM